MPNNEVIGVKFQKILDFIISTGLLYDGGVGGWVGDLKYLRGNLKYLSIRSFFWSFRLST